MQNLIWYEKHRAKHLKELVLPIKTKKPLRSFLRQREIPHLLFHGPAGSGKTTVARILIDSCAGASLILNASSSDRGVGTIKTRVKQFAASKHQGDKLNVVLFDEADGLTADAQMALKNTIETYHSNCRFIFTANNFDHMIRPIVSRCVQLEFTNMDLVMVIGWAQNILDKEKIRYDKMDVDKIVKRFYPDMRTIVNNLQACSIGGKFKIKNALSAFNRGGDIIKLLGKGDIRKIRQIIAGSTDFVWLYRLLFEKFVNTCPDDIQPEIIVSIAEYLYRDRTVADREINFVACLVDTANLLETDITF
ncbi:hypothetical protein AYK24_06620 [Thermoplasmatales archaeon SG8-52-4]|nr:MAG: hypothetical protein AYK24_06620 [Thermoplasmatales archaeon SG8-52-4]